MNTRIAEVFVLATNNLEGINNYTVINKMAWRDKPVVWKNHGQYRIIPKLAIEEFVRLHQQWERASKRMDDVAAFFSVPGIFWDDCTIIDTAAVELLLGEDTLDGEHDKPADKTES